MPTPDSPKLQMLRELEARKSAILDELQVEREGVESESAALRQRLAGASLSDAERDRLIESIPPDESAGPPNILRRQLDAMRSMAGANITPEEFERIKSHEFEYKPEFRDSPGAGRGRFAGPMTSELKQIPGVVEQRPDGMEGVNTPRLTMATASATGELARADKAKQAELDELNSRLSALEEATDPEKVGDEEALRAARSGRF